MASRINKWNYIIMGVFSFDIIFRGIPSTGKSYTILLESNETSHINITTEFPHHTLATDTCFIPNLLDLNKKYTDHPNNLEQCANSENPLLNSNHTHIWAEKRKLHHYNASDDSYFRCCYKSFQLSVKTVDIRHQGGDKSIEYQDCILFNETIEALHEFVRIYCYYKTNIIYDQIFAFAKKPPEAVTTSTIPHRAVHAQTQILISYNVLIFGMSSVSQQNFHRTMTKTDAVLKDRDVVDFFGYNRFHGTKYANLIPVLVGKKSTQVKCGTKSQDPFVWKQYKQHGFLTALVEDTKENSISYCDFTKPPTDFYFKPFLVEAEGIKRNSYCTGNMFTYKIFLNYIEQLCDSLQKDKLFGIFWQSSMSAQGWNYPIVTDGEYATLFQTLFNNGYLNQTIVILLSDLGTRYSSSKEGYLEQRLPLFKIILPPSFRDKYSIAYNNLRINSQRLITAFDVHATLIDLADSNAIRDEEILLRSRKDYSGMRGISLFLPISSKRTCKTVDLDDCICFDHKKMYNLMGMTAKYAAKQIIPAINKILVPYPQCPNVELSSLLQITKFSALHLKDKRFMEYLVRVRTNPSGTFEATVRFDTTWTVVSGISRLDYDERISYCVDDPLVKLYCFCKWPQVMKFIMPESIR